MCKKKTLERREREERIEKECITGKQTILSHFTPIKLMHGQVCFMMGGSNKLCWNIETRTLGLGDTEI